jgi:hypothetical protein
VSWRSLRSASAAILCSVLLELEQVEAYVRCLDLLAYSITSFTRNHLKPA